MKKKFTVCLFFLLLACNLFSLPVSKNGLLFNADVSVDFFTIAELTNSSLWYRTVMPGYSLSCRYDSFAGGNNLHRFDFRLKYFESNSFRVNTAELEPGTMRSFIFSAFGDYTRYLPITSNIDYITGLGLG